VIRLLSDPRVFNYVIYVALRSQCWSVGVGSTWKDVCYWMSAWAITATVTLGLQTLIGMSGNGCHPEINPGACIAVAGR